jgi:hypothetical protein
MKVGCVLEVCHAIPEPPHANEPSASPEPMEQVIKRGKELQDARIVSISISEEQAMEILRRLWPDRRRSLLGATCGKSFAIESAEQAAIVNEVLANCCHIAFNGEKQRWTLHTWPE